MPEFEWWTAIGRNLDQRFPPGSVGEQPWRRLVEDLENLRRRRPHTDVYHGAFDRFLISVNSLASWPPLGECRVFISHRQADVGYARAIAAIARREQYGYWLDVEDPILQYLDKAPIPSPAREILIAAIIEMGLLNASHVIAVMTGNTTGSKWVPYEIGRAKQRMLYSRFSATWINTQQITENDCGEYIRLAVITKTTANIEDWLRRSPCTPEEGTQQKCCVPPPQAVDASEEDEETLPT